MGSFIRPYAARLAELAEADDFYADPITECPMVNRYNTDTAFARKLDAERDAKRAVCHAAFDATRDEDLRRLGYL